MIIRKLGILLAFILGAVCSMYGQTAGIKTNIIDDATLNINIGVEFGLSPRWTLDVPGSFNGWELSEGRRWKHWWAQPGVRYWFCDRFGGHFVGAHTHGGQYNIGGFGRKLKDTRYQGWFVGGGISYGYAWVLGTHWNLEAEIGAGYAYTRYDRFRCTGCGKKIEENVPYHYVGPTKAAINLVYLF